MSLLKIPSGFSIAKARQFQSYLADRVTSREISFNDVRYVGGVDVSYRKTVAIAAAVIIDFPALKIVESKALRTEVKFPYVTTLLSFREAPVIFRLIKILETLPDVLLIEGHGLAHPYRCGLASHVGVILNIPTIGVAKNLLCGKIVHSGDNAYIVHEGRIVGAQVKSELEPKQAKPIYVSVGNMITLSSSVNIVRHCIRTGFRMPEPIRIAHMIAGRR